MIATVMRRKLWLTAGALAWAAVLVPCAGSPQSADDPVPEDPYAEILATIEELSADQDGVRSQELIDSLTTLGLRYQESGNYLLAATTIERALDIVRVNSGLYSLEQAPLIRQSREIERARGNFQAAWDREQELLLLIRRNAGDPETVPLLREMAESRLELFADYMGGGFPPEIVLGCYYSPPNMVVRRCTAGSKGTAAETIFAEMWRYYDDAIAILLDRGLHGSQEVRAMETELLRANYQYGNLLSPPLRYEQGKERLHRLLEYELAGSESVVDQARALAGIADWELLYSNNAAALNLYAEAHERLRQEGASAESIDSIFAPQVPVLLPTFFPNPLVTAATPESTGFIDVAFEITRYGDSRKIEVLDTTSNATEAAIADLVRLIAHGRFRPRVTDGQFARTAPIRLRYHLSEHPAG